MKPIGMILRQKAGINEKQENSKNVSLLSLEQQIAALEQDSGSSSSSSDDEEDSVENLHLEQDGSLIIEKDESGKVVRIASALQQTDRIAPLRPHQLPSQQCRFAEHASKDTRKRKVGFADEQQVSKRPQNSGLQRTVHELLAQYEPASLEKRPFYCRVCKFQAESTEELEAHRQTESHVKTQEFERRVCYCKLCRKQFTSPEQLKEHLKGKAHTERLDKVRQSNQDKRKFC
jgi:hypothetical protein